MSITKINADVMDLGDDYTFTGSVGGAGKIAQVVYANSYAFVSSTTLVPDDDTIMQNTEGVEIITLAITPTATDSILKVDFTTTVGSSPDYYLYFGIFQDSTAGALASIGHHNYANSNIHMTQAFVAGTASATTIKIRGGNSTTGYMCFNGRSTIKKGGDIPHTSLVITEVLV